jgi:phage terminase large subunit-like protein
MTEIVRWNPASRMAAYEDITTACRVGPRPQILWDTTSRGKNDVIQALVKQHEAHPDVHLITRGTMFDNPMLTRNYVLSEIEKYGKGTRAYDEEILGLVFAEAAGSLWEQDWIDLYRVHDRPLSPLLTVLGLDPALSGDKSADEVGVCRATLIAGGHVYVEDLGGKMAPEDYATLVVRECRRDASGVVVERNHVGQHARDLIRVHAKLAGMRVELLPNPDKPFPPRRPGTIHIREVVSHRSKETRAAPVAALYSAGKVHHVGVLARLEHEQTTWEPGTRRSPNRLDAAVFAVGEVAHIAGPTPRNVGKSIREAAKISERLQRAGASHGRGRIGL